MNLGKLSITKCFCITFLVNYVFVSGIIEVYDGQCELTYLSLQLQERSL